MTHALCLASLVSVAGCYVAKNVSVADGGTSTTGTAGSTGGGSTTGGGLNALCSPTTLDFGAVAVGTSPAPLQAVTCTNQGPTPVSFYISAVNTAPQYSVIDPNGPVSPSNDETLAPGASYVFDVAFLPGAVGTYDSQILVTVCTNTIACLPPTPISLSGVGVLPATTASAAASTGASAGSSTGTGTAGSGTTNGSSGIGATATGGSSGSTSGAPSCTLTDCGADQIEIRGSLANFCTGGTPANGVTVTNQLDPSQIATVDTQGNFYFCLDSGTELTITTSAPGYVEGIFATLDAAQSACLAPIEVLCTQSIELFSSLPSYDPSLASILVLTQSASGTGACADLAGWTYQLVDGSDQPVTASVGYVDGVSIQAGSSGTSAEGSAFLYNIDPSVGAVVVVGANPSFTSSDGGTACPNIGSQPPDQLTGSVTVQAGVVSDDLYLVP